MARIHPEAELAAILVEETRKPAHQCAKAAAELAALARQLARLYEREPSGESRSDPETTGRVNRLEGKARAIVGELVGLPPERAPITFNRDPRSSHGFAIFVKLPSGRSNSAGGEGWGI